MSYFLNLKNKLLKRIQSISDDRKAKNYLDFEVAYIDIMERPMSRTVQWTVFLIFFLIVLFVLWAYFGKLDIVIREQGRTMGNQKTLQVTAPEYGILSNIHVKIGQSVLAGDVLFELDWTDLDISEQNVKSQWEEARRNYYLNNSIYNYISSVPEGKGYIDTDIDFVLSEIDRQYLEQSIFDHNALLRQYQVKIDIVRQRYEEAVILRDSLIKNLEFIDNQLKVTKLLNSAGIYSDVNLNSITNEKDTKFADLKRAELQVSIADNEVQEAIIAKEVYLSNKMAQLLSKIREARMIERNSNSELKAIKEKIARRIVVANQSGIVQDIMYNKLGSSVMTQDVIVSLVPHAKNFHFEAHIRSSNRGKIAVGNRVKIKLDSFPFMKYGSLTGKIIFIGQDSVMADNRELMFLVHIQLDVEQSAISFDMSELSSGMGGMVEFVVGDRRIYEYFLSPLLEDLKTSLREP